MACDLRVYGCCSFRTARNDESVSASGWKGNSMAIPKRLKTVFALAQDHGWTVTQTKDAHPALVPPKGTVDHQGRPVALVAFAKTPSDHRADKNAIAALRRLGLGVPAKGHTKKKAQR